MSADHVQPDDEDTGTSPADAVPASVTDPWEMYEALRSALMDSTFAYFNAHPTRVSDAKRCSADAQSLIKLRTSVLYRFESLAFHVTMIERRKSACLRAIEAEPMRMFEQEYVREQVAAAARDMNFLFDDLVFSALSLFDYYGRLISIVMRPKPIGDHKWLGVVKWAERGTPVTLRTVDVVLRQNSEWVQGLADFRNRLIHQESIPTGAQWTWSLGAHARKRTEGESNHCLEITINTPNDFRESIQRLRDTTSAPLQLLPCAVWILGQTLDAGCELAAALTSDLPHSRWVIP